MNEAPVITICDNCGKEWRIENIVPLMETPALSERLSPGCEVPAGECPDPECGALCYLVTASLGSVVEDSFKLLAYDADTDIETLRANIDHVRELIRITLKERGIIYGGVS